MDNQNPNISIPQPQNATAQAPVDLTKPKIKRTLELIKESWQIYKKSFKVIIGITILVIISSILFDIFTVNKVNYTSLYILSLVFALAALLSQWIALVAIIAHLKDSAGYKASMLKGIKLFLSVFWVYILFSIILTGSFIILIIPSIILSIFFSLWAYVLVCEDKKGFSALLKSKDLISSYFWPVFGRFFVLGLIVIPIVVTVSLLAVFLMSAIIPDLMFGDVLLYQYLGVVSGFILTWLFFIPLFIIYGFLIYQDLRQIKLQIIFKEVETKRKVKFGLFGILGLPIIIFLTFFSVMNIIARDIPPIDDSDLMLSKLDISDEENAFYIWQEALIYADDGSLLEEKEGYDDVELSDQIINGEAWDPEYVARIVNQNRDLINKINQAAEKSYYQPPELQDPEKYSWELEIAPVNPMASIRLTKLKNLEAAYLFSQGRQKEAISEVFKMIKIAQIKQNSQATIIEYLIANAVKNIALTELRTIINMSSLSKDEYKEIIAELNKYKDNKNGFIAGFKADYIFTKNGLDNLGEQIEMMDDIPYARNMYASDFYFQPNKTKAFFADIARKRIANINKEYCSDTEPLEFNKKEYEDLKNWKLMFTQNALGELINSVIYVAIGDRTDDICLESFSIIGTQILIATKAFWTENERLPQSLNELVPEYFSEIPKDPFDGQPVRYLPEKKIIYSVGEDFEDANGVHEEDSIFLDDDEPAIKIKF